ncbi:MAG: hypothetical protein BGO61_10470 [Thiobacillus sp. 65-69]|nr:DUF302 domain-containing protein [Thiobacillus sp.]ODU91048.1 MAG: hypothetical protein ABT21_03305 [Thiobacillus sp. SCN 65-179]OJW37950.1 MAG: hypothetical protein BGO61_10470 [Thiobacillus sp. 65-69]
MRTSLIAFLFALTGALAAPAVSAAPQPKQASATDVYKIAVDRSVTLNDAAESMRLRANALNLKLVAELPLSKQVEVMTNQEQRTITIFQFCDALTAKQLIDLNLDFSVYMPCRIALIEDANGQGWLVMMDVNVDAVAKEKRLPEALKTRIKEVRESLVSIMQAGAKGEL